MRVPGPVTLTALAGLSAGIAAVGALAAPAGAAQPVGSGHRSTVLAAFATTAAAACDIHGTVYGPDGEPWDDVLVTATADGATKPAASALTYGGEFDLWVPGGSYVVRFHDPGGRVPDTSLEVSVESGSADVGEVHLTYGDATNVTPPTVAGSVRVGETLTGRVGTWDPGTGLGYSYLWRVKGSWAGSSKSLRLKPSWVGTQVTFTVTAGSDAWSPTSARSVALTVRKAVTRVDVTGPASATPAGRVVPVKVKVTDPSQASPRGTVVVTEDGRKVGQTLLSAGYGTVKVTGLRVGRHTLKVSWPGGTAAQPSSDTVVVRVTR